MSLAATKTAFEACIDADSKAIDTSKFVLACSSIATIYDALFMGVVAGQLKGDILNSSQGVQKAFLARPDTGATLQGLVAEELKRVGKPAVRTNKASATVSLLWAKRAVAFISQYLEFLATRRDWPAAQCAQQTYEVVLRRYHGWLTSKMISAAMNLAPSRDDIFAKLGVAKGGEAVLIEFVNTLKLVVEEIQRLYDEHDCDFPDTV